MAVKPLNHYSFTTPASVYDEEALTALELAGRCAAKINELIKSFIDFTEHADKRIDEAEDYLKNNLRDTANELMQILKDNNEIDGILSSSIFILPQFYGAKGDGETDDTEAFQTAINTAMETGRIIFIPDGEYVITDTLKISTLDVEDWEAVKNVRIWGAGNSRTVLLAKMTDKPVMLFEAVNNGNSTFAVAEHFTIEPYDDTYKYKFDGIKLVNAVGNIYRDLCIQLANTGVLLTTIKNTYISDKNTGYTEQNVFEDVRISATKCIVFNVGDNTNSRASFHGNIFERVSLTTNSNNSGGRAVCLSLESGYIYNCTFNIKTFQGGADSHLLYINANSGHNTGTISYEDFTGDAVKISTGNRATANFYLDGNIYGLGNINWNEYHTVRAGEIDDNGNVIDDTNGSIGKDKLVCRNLVPPVDLSAIALDGKTYIPSPLFGGVQDGWSGDTHNLIRYRNTTGNTEHGYLMACKEANWANSRFVLGTIPETARSLAEFTPGFNFYANGKVISSPSTGNTIEFRADGVAVNGSLVRRASEETNRIDYNGSVKFASGLTLVWGSIEAATGQSTTHIDLTSYGLKSAYNCQISPFSDVENGHKNYASWVGLNNTGFNICADCTSNAIIYWSVIGYTAPEEG